MQPVSQVKAKAPKKTEKKVKKTKTSKKKKLTPEQEKAKQEKHQKRMADMRDNGKGIHKPCKLSESLGKLLGTHTASRPQVVTQIWAYIKSKNLQNPENKREIFLDASLQKIFGQDKVTMFAMNKLLSQHLS